MYKLIVAHCKNNGIGINNNLPWSIKSDLKKFSKLTKDSGNNAVIMGSRTWLSIPKTPLKGRDNLILSGSIQLDNEKDNETEIIKSFKDIKSIKDYCEKKNYDTVWIIGGHQVYKVFLDDPDLKELHITYIDKEFNCDTFFPEFESKWTMIMHEIHSINSSELNPNEMINRVYDRLYIPLKDGLI